LAAVAGDHLCKRCKAVFLAAAVLLNEGVADENVIIPTLVLAKMAGGSPGYKALVEESHPTSGLGIVDLMYDAQAEDYAGWELASIIEGVPFMRIQPETALPRVDTGTQVLESVRIQVLSKRTIPSTVREKYEGVLAEYGVKVGLNIQGSFEYDFTFGYLGITVTAGPALTVSETQGPRGGSLQRPTRHFPPPVLVEGVYKALLGSAQKRTRRGFAHGLDLYGKRTLRAPENLIMAFAAWHIGGGAELTIPPQERLRVARALNRQFRPTKPLAESWPDPNETLWRNVEADAPRFVRLCARGAANYQTGV